MRSFTCLWGLTTWFCFILDRLPFLWIFNVFDVCVASSSVPKSRDLYRMSVVSPVVSIHIMRSFIWTFQSICKILPTSLIILKYLLRCYIVNYTVFYWSFVKRKLYETKSLKMFFIRLACLKTATYTIAMYSTNGEYALNSTIYRIFSDRIFDDRQVNWVHGVAYTLFDNYFNLDPLLHKDRKIPSFLLIELHRLNKFLSIK